MATQTILHESWEQMLQRVENGKPFSSTHDRSSRENERIAWRGGVTFEEALVLARIGWPEGLAKMRQSVRIVEEMIPTRKLAYEVTMSPVGPGTLDMGRFIQGHPEPWITSHEIEEKIPEGQIITVNINTAFNSNVDADSLFTRGAKVVALVNILESLGKRVEINAVDYIVSNGDYLLSKTVVKRTDDPIDLERIAFLSAHPAITRRLCISILEQIDALMIPELAKSVLYGSYGQATDWHESGAINIPSIRGSDRLTKENLVEWITGRLHELGIVLELDADEPAEDFGAPRAYVDPMWSKSRVIDEVPGFDFGSDEAGGSDKGDEEGSSDDEFDDFSDEDDDESGDGDESDGDEEESDDSDTHMPGDGGNDAGDEEQESQEPVFCCLRCAWIAQVQEIVNAQGDIL